MLIQKRFSFGIMLLIVLCITGLQINAQPDLWTTAYYAGWMQGFHNNGHLPADKIDYSAVTHIVHFSVVPVADGSLNPNSNSITEINSAELITRAHAEGKKVIISVGGWNSGPGFRGAANPLNLSTFVQNLIVFMTSRGYDGIDIDWEPLNSSDALIYTSMITAIRTALNVITPRPILTCAVGRDADIIAQVHQHFDQINIMTYDYSGAWPGWVTWHNSPIDDGGFLFPSTNRPPPSARSHVDEFLQAGVPANKIGIGIDFYGYIWSRGNGTPTEGVSEPRQTWTSAPVVQSNVPYHSIMNDYYQPQYYMWDSLPKASYLRIDNEGSENDKFISYDDEKSIEAKFDFARSKGIGGLIIWELGGGYRPDLPQGQRDFLLQTVKAKLFQGTTNNDDEGENFPVQFTMEQNYPNPFNPYTTIQFSLNESSVIQLDIYDITGQKVVTLVNEKLNKGTYNIVWNASQYASGIYLYQLRSGNHVISKKMTLMK